MRKRYRIYITGNVQRVGFRNQAFEKACAMSITGKAMYIDHALLIEAEGELGKLMDFLSWCKLGPESCRIENIEIIELPLEHSLEFSVVHGIISSEKLTDLFCLIH